MTLPPWLLLGATVSLALSLLYQITSRRYGWRVVAYWIVISAGLFGAEVLAESLGWNISRVGDLRLLPDITGALAVIAILWFLGI